jgi:septal ring factor EnvC (AmiA/AmiB activator)
MSIPFWITMGLTGMAGLAFGVHIGDSHRRRLEKALAAKEHVVEEMNKKIEEKDKIISEARRDSRNKAAKLGSAGAVVRKTTSAAKRAPRQPQKKNASKGTKNEIVSEPRVVYPVQDPSKLLTVT